MELDVDIEELAPVADLAIYDPDALVSELDVRADLVAPPAPVGSELVVYVVPESGWMIIEDVSPGCDVDEVDAAAEVEDEGATFDVEILEP